jgi:hypothetical protein
MIYHLFISFFRISLFNVFGIIKKNIIASLYMGNERKLYFREFFKFSSADFLFHISKLKIAETILVQDFLLL